MKLSSFFRLLSTIINFILNYWGLRLVRLERIAEYDLYSNFYWNDPFLKLFGHPEEVKKLVKKSKSQIRQDLFVISELNFKTNGFFVEIGAQNGFDGSNTYLLEKSFSWSGILCEPSKTYKNEIAKFRNCLIDNRCVWGTSNLEIDFIDYGKTGLSTLSKYTSIGIHGDTRLEMKSSKYKVGSVSLNDLLKQYKAPHAIDYISIDTEGSEYEILSTFDFNLWDVKIFTVEHNFDDELRKNILELMKKNKYRRVHMEISYQDDWFVRDS